jgi:2-aminoadipate transaminase
MAITRYAARVPSVSTAVHVAPHPSQISLGGGYAFPDMLPDISQVAADVAREFRVQSLQYGPLMGLPELRDEIVRLLGEDGVSATRDNILILNGAKNGLDLALRLFVEKGDGIIVSRPNYATALHIFRNHEASFIEIDMDREGMRTDQLEETLRLMRGRGQALPKMLYVVPDFHNPTGITLAAARRRRLVELAEEYDFVIAEDDPYRRIKFEGDFVPPIQSFDTYGRVIGLGTVSKIFAPGIRVGWANAAPDIIKRMAAMKSDGGSPPFSQRIVATMLGSGAVARHTRALSVELKVHRDTMIGALREHLPEVQFTAPRGGYYLWVELPAEVDCDRFASEAEHSGVTIFSGSAYFASIKLTNYIRLCYSNSKPEQIDRGIRILKDVMRRVRESAARPAVAGAQSQHLD